MPAAPGFNPGLLGTQWPRMTMRRPFLSVRTCFPIRTSLPLMHLRVEVRDAIY